VAELQRVRRLYAERYTGFNVRHFHQILRRAACARAPTSQRPALGVVGAPLPGALDRGGGARGERREGMPR